MPKLGKGTITFDQGDWLAGLNPQYTTGLTDVPAPQVGDGLSTATRFNPFRYLGYAAPGFDPTDVTNVSVVSGVIRNVALSAESSTNYGYLIADDAELHRLDIANKSLSNSGSWPHTITGAGAITGNDVVAYTSNVASTATPCVFYSFNDAGGGGLWNIGRFNTSAGTFDDDFMSTVPASPPTPSGSNKPHPMIIGANDILYYGDGNVLRAYDGATGADGTCSTSLTLPQGYIITSVTKIAQPVPYLVVFAYYNPAGNSVAANTTSSGPATAFFYDYLSLDPTYVIDLNDRAVTAGFEWNGTIGCFTQGNNLVNDGADRFSRMKVWNGSIFETVATFIGNAPIHGGVDIVGDSVQWLAGKDGESTTLYSYGSPYSEVRAGLNRLAAGTGQSRGTLRTIGGATGFQILSTGTSTSGGLQYMKVGTFAGSSSAGSVCVAPEFSVGKKGKVRSVRVDFAKTSGSTGCPIDVYLLYEEGNTSQVIATTSLITSSNITKWYYKDSAGVNLPLFFEMRVLVRWTAGAVNTDAPVVRRVVVQYEEVNVEGT